MLVTIWIMLRLSYIRITMMNRHEDTSTNDVGVDLVPNTIKYLLVVRLGVSPLIVNHPIVKGHL